jgi:hypothetical protein
MSEKTNREGTDELIKYIESRIKELKDELATWMRLLELLSPAAEGKGGKEKTEEAVKEEAVEEKKAEEKKAERKVRMYPIERDKQRIAVIEWDGETAVAKLDRPIADDKKAGFVANKWAASEKLDIKVELMKNSEGQITEVVFSPVRDEKVITEKIVRIVRWLAKNY